MNTTSLNYRVENTLFQYLLLVDFILLSMDLMVMELKSQDEQF